MKGTGAKRNVCPGSCVSTGAKFPVAPVESAPMFAVRRQRKPRRRFVDVSAARRRRQTTKHACIVRYASIIIPAKARNYAFTGVGLYVCLSVCYHDN